MRARTLRKTQTDAEAKLWHRLRNRQFLGLKFRREHPIGPYFAVEKIRQVAEAALTPALSREREREQDQDSKILSQRERE